MASSNKIVSVKIVRGRESGAKKRRKKKKSMEEKEISKMEKLRTRFILVGAAATTHWLPVEHSRCENQAEQRHKFICTPHRRSRATLQTCTQSHFRRREWSALHRQSRTARLRPFLWTRECVSLFHLSSIKFQVRRMHTRRKQFVGAKPKLTLLRKVDYILRT